MNMRLAIGLAGLLSTALLTTLLASAQVTDEEAGINFRILNLGKGKGRDARTRQLALEVRKLPFDGQKVMLAVQLVDLGAPESHATLQEIATTLAVALAEHPTEEYSHAYDDLAGLIRYEHAQATLNHLQMRTAIEKLNAEDRARQQADFTLVDLTGRTWSLKGLAGKTVLLTFGAPGCAACEAEIPALIRLQRQFEKQGLVVLAVEHAEAKAVRSRFKGLPYPVLVDADSKVSDAFHVEAIPVILVYDRTGKLSATGKDLYTEDMLREKLGEAGLR